MTTYVLYWATILSACTMGETAGDYLSFGLELGYARSAVILGVLLLVALLLEWRAQSQNEYRYWATIIIMSTTGTALADFITRTLELGYARGSALLITLFILIYFAEWFYRRRNSSRSKAEHKNVFSDVDRDIKTRGLPKTDAFYWMSILVASTFGTTMGDFTSDVLGLGFGGGAMLLVALLLIVLVVDYLTDIAEIALYWAALVIASTIGATTGDFLTKPDALNLGYAIGSLILITVLSTIFFIRYKLAKTKPA
ncbi:MAG: hypothetical protein ICV60_03540 [Pyrinomonadaceae bacterium]|nr:hypothetical protein [Pyrinomonadaceae bacterium]